MAWEIRNGRRYYTRSTKVGGRVIRTYVGTGPEAEQAAAADAARRAEREETTRLAKNAQDRYEAARAAGVPLDDVTDLFTRAALLAAGFHRHDRGTWRKKRHVHDRDH